MYFDNITLAELVNGSVNGSFLGRKDISSYLSFNSSPLPRYWFIFKYDRLTICTFKDALTSSYCNKYLGIPCTFDVLTPQLLLQALGLGDEVFDGDLVHEYGRVRLGLPLHQS